MVLGLNVVAWHDRIAGEWRVFDDVCPHRLAPLSEGRIDHKGRLQCAYHGWCYGGAGTCKFIPQAPALGPPVHKNSKACVASYPCVVQNKMWFYPRTEAEYKDVLQMKRPPYIPEIDVEYDQEGGEPIKMKIQEESVTGFLCALPGGSIRFTAPCTYQGTTDNKVATAGKTKPWLMLVALCIPVAPGRSRIIYAFPFNSGPWERKYAEKGLDNWRDACYVPTSSDRMVVAFRNWFRKYWSHVIQCTSCSAALKAMKALEAALKVASVAVVGFLVVAKGTLVTSTVQKTMVVSAAVLCFAASRWLADFIEKSFYFQDYVHADH
ncbi:hypothetical protein EJB05_37453, partial [Eragrostis curvula]